MNGLTLNFESYARIQPLMSNESTKISLSVYGKTIENITNKSKNVCNKYEFNQIFNSQSSNRQCFDSIVPPMINNVMKGYDSVLMAFGQTASGKTYSIIGKPKANITGILQMTLTHLTKQKNIQKVELSAIEAFGCGHAKIWLFDLFNEANQIKAWCEKRRALTMDSKKAIKVIITDENDAYSKITYAHSASHCASTGTNIESSRGHIAYIITITQHQFITSHLVFVDCAGSNGETAFTAKYKANVSAEQLLCRRFEAGTINIGLSQIKSILHEWMKNGRLKVAGNGMRRILYPFITAKTFISVLFTLSISATNAKANQYTLDFFDGIPKVPVSDKQKLIVFGYCRCSKMNNIPNDIIFSILGFYKLNIFVINTSNKKLRMNHLEKYCRVRPLMPWEPRKISVRLVAGNIIQNTINKICNEYEFNDIFGVDADNKEIFDVMVPPMIEHVLCGCNCILIGYGGRGSGKTFTLIGKELLGVNGILMLIIKQLLDNQNVSRLELCAVEIFGNNPTKIQLFDLLDAVNSDKCWKNKKGDTSLNIDNANKVCLTKDMNINKIIYNIHKCAHYAATGKHPESIRGHIVFIVKVHQNCFVSNFVIVDCCGPESESSFSMQFKQSIGRNELIQRRLEYKCINIGLTDLSEMLKELKTENKLKKYIGKGLRRILYPYFTSINAKFCILFTISPAINCAKSTESTFKFAANLTANSNQSWYW